MLLHPNTAVTIHHQPTCDRGQERNVPLSRITFRSRAEEDIVCVRWPRTSHLHPIEIGQDPLKHFIREVWRNFEVETICLHAFGGPVRRSCLTQLLNSLERQRPLLVPKSSWLSCSWTPGPNCRCLRHSWHLAPILAPFAASSSDD